MDLVKCPICGEEYSSSYPECPFCEEDGEEPRKIKFHPGRHVIADKKKARSARGGLIAALVLVLALLSWYLFGDNIVRRAVSPEPEQTAEGENEPAVTPEVSDDPFFEPIENDPVAGEEDPSQTGAEENPETVEPVSEPDPDLNVDVSNASLSRKDFTLSGSGDSWQLKVSGTEATPHWSIDNGNVASISPDGTVKAKANGTTTVRAKVGTRELSCIVRVINTGVTAEAASEPTYAEPIAAGQGTAAAPGTADAPGTAPAQETPPQTEPPAPAADVHVNASSLGVKTNYGTVLQKDPGSGYPDCTVRINGDPISLIVTGTDVPVSGWTSDDTSIVTVGADGHLSPVKVGSAHVTAKVGDAEITCIIRVRN